MTFSIYLLFGIIAVLAIAERIPAIRRRSSRLMRANVLTDLAFFGLSWLAIAQLTFSWVAWATVAVHGESAIAIPMWLETILAIVLLDLGNYVAHWSMHRSETLWRIHAVHHSSPMLDWLATFRSHLLEQVFRRAVAPLLLIAMGVSTPAVAIASALFIAWGILNHANLRVNLRFLEPIFITPRLHHLHHVPASAERNLGTVFNLWDRLTGRFIRDEVAPETLLGNGDPNYPQTFGALLQQPFRRSRRHFAAEL